MHCGVTIGVDTCSDWIGQVASHMFSKRLLTQGATIAFKESEALIERLRSTAGNVVDLQVILRFE